MAFADQMTFAHMFFVSNTIRFQINEVCCQSEGRVKVELMSLRATTFGCLYKTLPIFSKQIREATMSEEVREGLPCRWNG